MRIGPRCDVTTEDAPPPERLYAHLTITNVPFFDRGPKLAIRSKAIHSGDS